MAGEVGWTRTVVYPGDESTFPQEGMIVRVHYEGRLEDGRDIGRPFEVPIGLGKTIRGFEESLLEMSVGERSRIEISPDFAYGEKGHPPVIPPNAKLIFDIELLDCYEDKESDEED